MRQLSRYSIGVRAHLVISGRSPETSFSRNAQPSMQADVQEAYSKFATQGVDGRGRNGPVTHAADVAQAIWRAAVDPATPPRPPPAQMSWQ